VSVQKIKDALFHEIPEADCPTMLWVFCIKHCGSKGDYTWFFKKCRAVARKRIFMFWAMREHRYFFARPQMSPLQWLG